MVAEKPSIALALGEAHSQGAPWAKRRGISPSAPVYEFDGAFAAAGGIPVTFRVTSTVGHMFSLDFPPQYNDQNKVDPIDLFDAPTLLFEDACARMSEHLRAEARGCFALVLWLDCGQGGREHMLRGASRTCCRRSSPGPTSATSSARVSPRSRPPICSSRWRASPCQTRTRAARWTPGSSSTSSSASPSRASRRATSAATSRSWASSPSPMVRQERGALRRRAAPTHRARDRGSHPSTADRAVPAAHALVLRPQARRDRLVRAAAFLDAEGRSGAANRRG